MLGEVAAPLAPEFAGLLAALTLIAATLVCIGIIVVLDHVARAVVGTFAKVLGYVPFIGHVLSSPVNDVVHWMGGEFAAAEAKLDGVLARFLHELGILYAWTMHEIRDLSKLVYTLSVVMVGTAVTDALHALIRYVEGRVRAAELTIGRLLNRVGVIEHRIESTVLHWIEPRLRAVEHDIGHVIEYDIAALRSRARAILDRLDNLWHRVRRLDALLGTAAFTAAVAVALTRLDLNWIRCRNWGKLGRTMCGLPSALIDSLLADTLAVLAISDLCDITKALVAAAEVAAPALDALVAGIDDLLACQGADRPPALAVASAAGAPVVAALSL